MATVMRSEMEIGVDGEMNDEMNDEIENEEQNDMNNNMESEIRKVSFDILPGTPTLIVIDLHREVVYTKEQRQMMIKMLPPIVQQRIALLKNLQLEHDILQQQKNVQLTKLKEKYRFYKKVIEYKQRLIISGLYDPPKQAKLYKDIEMNLTLNPESACRAEKWGKDMGKKAVNAKGIPWFWITVLYGSVEMSNVIHPCDEILLHSLHSVYIDDKFENFCQLIFEFRENDFFTNSKLIKTYIFRKSAVLAGPAINFGMYFRHTKNAVKIKGCTIDWKPGKDLTDRHGVSDPLELMYLGKSFFEFFSTPPEDLDCFVKDVRIAHLFCTLFVPYSLFMYTGEMSDQFEFLQRGARRLLYDDSYAPYRLKRGKQYVKDEKAKGDGKGAGGDGDCAAEGDDGGTAGESKRKVAEGNGKGSPGNADGAADGGGVDNGGGYDQTKGCGDGQHDENKVNENKVEELEDKSEDEWEDVLDDDVIAYDVFDDDVNSEDDKDVDAGYGNDNICNDVNNTEGDLGGDNNDGKNAEEDDGGDAEKYI